VGGAVKEAAAEAIEVGEVAIVYVKSGPEETPIRPGYFFVTASSKPKFQA
jgi:hypothetical protein